MWRPGQLITINDAVYRVKRVNHNSKVFPCKLCIFEKWQAGCSFPNYKGGRSGCVDLIPDDCYFVKVSP